MAGTCAARNGEARQAWRVEWMCGVARQAGRGPDRLGWGRSGKAGNARPVKQWRGKDRRGRRGEDWPGAAGHGAVWQARRGRDWPNLAATGLERQARRGVAGHRRGWARQAWHGMALTGELWRGQDWQARFGWGRLG